MISLLETPSISRSSPVLLMPASTVPAIGISLQSCTVMALVSSWRTALCDTRCPTTAGARSVIVTAEMILAHLPSMFCGGMLPPVFLSGWLPFSSTRISQLSAGRYIGRRECFVVLPLLLRNGTSPFTSQSSVTQTFRQGPLRSPPCLANVLQGWRMTSCVKKMFHH